MKIRYIGKVELDSASDIEEVSELLEGIFIVQLSENCASRIMIFEKLKEEKK